METAALPNSDSVPVSVADQLCEAERSFIPSKITYKSESPFTPVRPALSVGLVSGCFGGVAWGLMVGVGASRTPFAHSGVHAATPLCGVVIGATYGVGLTSVMGYRLEGGGRVANALAQLRARVGAAASAPAGAGRAAGLAARHAAGVVLWAPLSRALQAASGVRARLTRGDVTLMLPWRPLPPRRQR